MDRRRQWRRINRLLTASPAQPQVMTKPMAVPVIRGNAVPVMASTVGKTGAIDNPAAAKTSAAATAGLSVRSMRNVVTAMAMEAASVTSMARNMNEDGGHADSAQ